MPADDPVRQSTLEEKARELDPGAFDPALFLTLGTGSTFDRRARAYAKAREALG